MIISPYSDLAKFSSGGKWEATSTNFPALKHFWKCTETSGLTITDSINNVVITGTAMTFPATGAVDINKNTYGAVTSGTLQAPATKFPLILVVGNLSTQTGAVIGIGHSGALENVGFSICSTSITTASVSDGSTAVTGTAYTQTGVTGRGLYINAWDDASGLVTFETTAGRYGALDAAATTGITTIASLSNSVQISAGIQSIYGIAVFYFTTLPSTGLIDSAVSWMTYQWQQGNDTKWIYPGLRGIS